MAAAAAVAAASVAFSSLHLSSSSSIFFRQPSLSCRNIRRISLIRASSSTPSTEFEFNISFGSDKSKTDSQEPGRRVSRRASALPLMIPWIVRGEDGQIKFQTTPPAQFLHDMANAKTTPTSPKKMKKKATTPNNKESNLTSQPKYSKAARRFYNENFRDPPQRLAKVLASAGVASRRSCEELIFEGLVTVNGSVCNTPQTKVDLSKDVVYVKGNRISKKLPPKVYLALNKPKGYICSSGEKETKSVLTLVDDYLQSWDKRNKGIPKPRLFTIGRLDVATTGLIIVTNDGDFAHKLTHPSSTLSKEYIAVVEGSVSKRQLVAISEGTVIDGVRCIPDSVELLPAQVGVTRARLRIVVHDGRNHEVRELVKKAGLEIHSLKRLRIGGYRLPPDLGLGKHVELNQGDLKALGGMLQPTAAS